MAPGPTCTDYPNEWPPGRARSRERKPPAAWRSREGRRDRERKPPAAWRSKERRRPPGAWKGREGRREETAKQGY